MAKLNDTSVVIDELAKEKAALPRQGQFNFDIQMTPLAIMYLLSMYENEFDKRLHNGDFKTHVYYPVRIGELLQQGLIEYGGSHKLTPMGKDYINNVLKVKP